MTRTLTVAQNSSSDLQHAQQRRRRHQEQLHLQRGLIMHLVTLALLLSCSAAAAQIPSRFFYAASQPATATSNGPQTKVRLLREATETERAAADTTSCCTGEPATLLNGTDYTETETSTEGAKELFKRSVTRSAVRMASPAICSPQPTIVELKPLLEAGEQVPSTVSYQPTCTRINRCSGCCGSTLISCQPTKTEILELRVRKVERIGTTVKLGYAIVNVEQHLVCKCDCRIKEGDCNAYQVYRQDLCRCECLNTDARDKCLEQQDNKYWDDANCTCACRYNQSCTTGTVFDETQCKCMDPTPSETVDRKRFIVQAVPLEPDNATIYEL